MHEDRDHNDNGWIQTYSGGRFYPHAPRASDVRIDDIAHALSNMCRFTGHCSHFYSVAQHSVLVAGAVAKPYRLQALLHDASEAYLVDIPRPLKRLPQFAGYLAMEAATQAAIYEAFGIEPDEASNQAVDFADKVLLATEARDLMPRREAHLWSWLPEPEPWQIEPLSPKHARAAFLSAYAAIVEAL
jgi:hypothetical protein